LYQWTSWMWQCCVKNMPNNDQEASRVLFTSSLLPVCHTPWPSSWRQCFASKCPWTSTALQGITSQKILILFSARKFAYTLKFKKFQNMFVDQSLYSRQNTTFLKVSLYFCQQYVMYLMKSDNRILPQFYVV
jgi:hypothetical protein